MKTGKPLNIFYEEPDPDRWIKFDRYPRRIIRRAVRGKQLPGGVAMVAINLVKGLDELGISYRFNDYRYIKKHPDEIACIIGKPHVFFDRRWKNPVIFGAGIYSHPSECPHLLEKYPNVKKVLVPGEWMRKMFEPFYGDKVVAWPVGIETEKWVPVNSEKKIDFLIYDKIRWNYDQFNDKLIQPIIKILNAKNLTYQFIRYGYYKPEELKEKLATSRAAIFLCEHETQGLAYQQMLSSNVPILGWEQRKFWLDPYYYPDNVKYGPVSAMPYWDARCGEKFSSIEDFSGALDTFQSKLKTGAYSPRDYILENLTLAKCAEAYVAIHLALEQELKLGAS